jgi:TrmH family RNA methyltransferase
MAALKERRIAVVAAVAASAEAIACSDFDWREPAAILIGNEGAGLSQDLLERADALVTIPMPGPVESLNAAVAASVLLYEAARQREHR